jgi:hypothetical protein
MRKARTSVQRPAARMSNLPQHDLPEPYAELMRIGDSWDTSVYSKLADQLRRRDGFAAAERLAGIAADRTFAEYGKSLRGADSDRREFTRFHALGVLEEMPEEAASAVQSVVSLLDDEDDDELHEMLPDVFGAVGEVAIDPLTVVLRDANRSPEVRAVAEEAIEEIGTRHSECRDRVIKLFEAELAASEDPSLAGFFVCSLMDLGSEESLPIIRQAFGEGRVDDWMVDLPDVERFFQMPHSAPAEPVMGEVRGRMLDAETLEACAEEIARLTNPHRKDQSFPDIAPDPERALDAIDVVSSVEHRVPFESGPRIGRNDPCPCGSGKKYKRCCADSNPSRNPSSTS